MSKDNAYRCATIISHCWYVFVLNILIAQSFSRIQASLPKVENRASARLRYLWTILGARYLIQLSSIARRPH